MTPLRVLIVEDNPADARFIREVFRDAFESPTSFTEGEDAGMPEAPETIHVERLADGLETLESDEIDVVLLDLNLPDSRGIETLTTVREAAPTVPTVVLTGLKDHKVGVQALQAGAEEFLVKGEISPELLARTVHHTVERVHHKQALGRSGHPSKVLERFLSLVREYLPDIDRSKPDAYDPPEPAVERPVEPRPADETPSSRGTGEDAVSTEQPKLPEERILEVLSTREGVMMQAEIASKLGWTDSKTSRVLSDMENDGRISRFWVGREKAVFLPGREPEFLRNRLQ